MRSGRRYHRVEHSDRPGIDDGRRNLVHRSDEPGHERVRRVSVDLGGRAELLHRSLRHHRDAIGDGQRLLLVVGDEQRRDPEIGLDAADLVAQARSNLGVERAQRLIEQQHRRFDRQRPRQRHPLLLAARELMRVLRRLVGELNEFEDVGDATPALGTTDLAGAETVFDVVGDRQVGEQAVALEDHAHVAFVGWQTGDVVLVHLDRSAVGGLEAGGDAKGCRLAAARWAEQADQFTRFDPQVEPLEGDRLAECLSNIVEGEIAHVQNRVVRVVPTIRGSVGLTGSAHRFRASQDGEDTEQDGRADQGQHRQGDAALRFVSEELETEHREGRLVEHVGDRELPEHHRDRQERSGDETRHHVGQDRPAQCRSPSGTEATRGVDECAHVDRLDTGIDRSIGERQRHHHVERHQRPLRTEQPSGVRSVEGGDPGRQGDRWDDVRQHREELHDAASLREPQVDVQRRGNEQRECDRHGQRCELEAELQRRPEQRIVEDLLDAVEGPLVEDVRPVEQRHRDPLHRLPRGRDDRRHEEDGTGDQHQVGAESRETRTNSPTAHVGCQRSARLRSRR